MIRKHFLVSGRVQGVGFRNFVYRQASEFGIKGAVRNLRDGRVEILAEGPTDAMTAFEEAVKRGPRLANVMSLQSQIIPAGSTILDLDQLSGFEVYQDGEAPWLLDS